MTREEIANALTDLRPGSEWVLHGTNLADIVWLDNATQPPSESEVQAAVNSVKARQVNAERDRRLTSFPFEGKMFDFCDGKGSDINIAGAGTLALGAIIEGKQAGDLRWADPNVDFTWVAADNSIVTMDALTTLNFAKAAAEWKARHIRKARTLKDMTPIPADYASDSRWT